MTRVAPERLLAAYRIARNDLLERRDPSGHWVGQLASSALATATAVSALTLVERNTLSGSGKPDRDGQPDSTLSPLIVAARRWLADHQNDDGGWGDTPQCYSNVATTLLVLAAFYLSNAAADHTAMIQRAEQYVQRQGGLDALGRRYGKDRTFAVPILTNTALAGIVPWQQVPALPFELACVPQKLYRFLRLHVVSYAIPALVAVGQARFFHRRPRNPITRLLRAATVRRSLDVLNRMQPASGGFLEATPLTSFVVMSLASIGRSDHPVVRRGTEFIVASVRPDGSWPIDTNLATWNTTLGFNALANGPSDHFRETLDTRCLDWLLSCQYQEIHPYTNAAAGGWGWTDLSGSVPDADDTAGALLALAAWRQAVGDGAALIERAAAEGIRWLLDLQNSDGGWPTFCRGWGKLPFDRSGADLTAHAIRALHAWHSSIHLTQIDRAIRSGLDYLASHQQPDGSWIPLWFGNQDHPREENPVYGTAKVLLAFRDLQMLETSAAVRGFRWLADHQNPDGGWGGPAMRRFAATDRNASAAAARAHQVRKTNSDQQMEPHRSSVEETALVVEALLRMPADGSMQSVIDKGLEWLITCVEQNRHREYSPIGFYFAKLWYHEEYYPVTFTTGALGQAVRMLLEQSAPQHTVTQLPGAPSGLAAK